MAVACGLRSATEARAAWWPVLAVLLLAILAAACMAAPPKDGGAAAQLASRTSHQLENVTFLVLKDTGWSPTRVQSWAAHLPERLAGCRIALENPALVLSDRSAPLPSADWEQRYRELARSLPPPDGPLFLFTDRLGLNAEVGGAALTGLLGRSVAVIARRNGVGRRFAPEQTLAHELGHLLGLRHVPAVTPEGQQMVDLITPRGCLSCEFTEVQCAALRAHPLVQRQGASVG